MKSVLLPIVVAQVSFVLLLAALKSRRRPSRGVQTTTRTLVQRRAWARLVCPRPSTPVEPEDQASKT